MDTPTTAIYLNGHSMKLLSNYLCLHHQKIKHQKIKQKAVTKTNIKTQDTSALTIEKYYFLPYSEQFLTSYE